MKAHYINILLFAIPLNILEYNQRNHNSTTHTSNTKSIKPHRSLCECDLYIPNYDNEPEMKDMMENFNRQTSERFREYDEKMQDKRKQCKEQCDKEIQKIILKDKIEKELTENFATLETNIDTNGILTCVCEKSAADKTEKFCLKCGYELGGGMMQSWSLLGGMGIYGYKMGATAAAEKLAIAAGHKAGIKAVIAQIKDIPGFNSFSNIPWSNFINESNYSTVNGLLGAAKSATGSTCSTPSTTIKLHCHVMSKGEQFFGTVVRDGIEAAATKTRTLQNSALAQIDTTFLNSTTVINSSIITILIIVLIMVIIYLVLRYRKKKKMKKKHQYIKLLKE
ncbi:PIR protein, putative [Plasmodium sp.]|nr:PIR protein, putative [Plasmodium sp.]